jgi:leucyl aminopeptidase (aminopeptidase T)
MPAPKWASNIIHTCVGVEAEEKVLIAVDQPLAHVRDALLEEASEVSPKELWTHTFPDDERPFTEYPPGMLQLATQADAVILMLASLDPKIEMPAWVAGRQAILAGGARLAAGAYIEQSILDHELSADYEEVAAVTEALKRKLTGCSEITIQTRLGTDLRLFATGRQWLADSGKLRGRGTYGNLPGGEIAVAPLEDSAEGHLVVDKTLPGLVLSEPVHIAFREGRATEISDGPGASYLLDVITDGEKRADGQGCRVVAELGIGTNPRARLQGNIVTDEKAAGTIHIAIGRNDFLGGNNAAPIHVDAVVGEPSVVVDGERIIQDGRFLVEMEGSQAA